MEIISKHMLKDPRIPEVMTITNISLSNDLHYCHLYFSMIENEKNKEQAVKGLNSAVGFIQKIIADKLALKYTPKIVFRYDVNEEKAYKMEQLLDNLSKQRET